MDEEITLHLRNQLNIDLESGEFTTAGGKVIPDVSSSSTASHDQEPGPSTSKSAKRRSYAINPTLEALIGQANLQHARGHSEEAITLLYEVIKEAPYSVQSYLQLADIYSDLNQTEKSFEFRLLATLLNNKTTAAEWEEIGEMAKNFGRMELAVASFAKAIRTDPTNWIYYEKRIQVLESIGDIELAMKTRLQAAQAINCQTSKVNFPWIDKLIKTAAEYFCSLKDEEKATEALETFILRSREFGRSVDSELLALLSMWMNKGRYEDSAKSILALHQNNIHAHIDDGTPAINISFTNAGFVIKPFPPHPNSNWVVEDSFSTTLLSHLIICFIHIDQHQAASKLTAEILKRVVGVQDEAAFLDIARTLQTNERIEQAIEYVERLLLKPGFTDNSDAWFLYGFLLQSIDQLEKAQSAYETVIGIQQGHIDARVNLSTILQKLGKGEQALDTLKDFNLDSCSQVPDERLLIRQAEVLLEQGRTHQYVRCLRLLLIPHFYVIHRLGDDATRPSKRHSGATLHTTLKKYAFEAIFGGSLEKTVKRLGHGAFVAHRITDELSGNELHDYSLKLAEGLYYAGDYKEMLHVVCYAFLHPKIIELRSSTFLYLLFFGSVKAKEYTLAFEFLRYFTLSSMYKLKEGERQTLYKKLHIAMNYVLCHQQRVAYHRFIMRQIVKIPENEELHIISGNNSLATGSYRHALGEYYRVWLKNRNSPLLCLLIALTFTHIACKKDISSRHMVALRAVAFMKRYQKLRGPSQEVCYNIGRMFHQMGILPNAIRFYERVLREFPVPMVSYEHPDTGEIIVEQPERYDLRRNAAYNLALIYESSGNRELARNILEEFCTI